MHRGGCVLAALVCCSLFRLGLAQLLAVLSGAAEHLFGMLVEIEVKRIDGHEFVVQRFTYRQADSIDLIFQGALQELRRIFMQISELKSGQERPIRFLEYLR